ncbi:MAG: (Fe-S)-binding protein [Saprospiraceae bacterium]|nr:(Fe-S)-binding protein [Saprospiraceae bacterium]
MSSIIFIGVSATVFFLAYKSFSNVFKAIHLGKSYDWNNNMGGRWKDVFLVAFGQKKMFKNVIPAVLHFLIYAAFLITQIEFIEIFIDGIFGSHRILAPFLGGFYTFMVGSIEVLSLLAFFATVAFLWRRNLLKLPRFTKTELDGWPRLDANFILFGEILLIAGIFAMNGADLVLQERLPDLYHSTGVLPVSKLLSFDFFSAMDTPTLQVLERIGWWSHVLVVFGFILYLPNSKHLHIFLAFPNVYFSKKTPRGEMANMPDIMNEVRSMLGLQGQEVTETVSDVLPVFGASDVKDLTGKNIMDAYSCTECGRCTAVCPANLTGKKLSPRKIMMDVRDRATEVVRYEALKNRAAAADNATDEAHKGDGKNLFNYISREEIRACTTCNACVEACPVLIDPLDIILQMRRYEVLTESVTAEAWTPMFTSLENQGCVWQVPQERTDWIKEQ